MPNLRTWQPFMSIIAIGINHKTAPVTLREKVYFSLDKLSLYLQDLLSRGYVREAMLLSTCNRSELYCDADDISQVRDWFCAQTTIAKNEVESALYIYRDEEAVSHMMRVACGLDSMVIGEPQILGQMKDAFSESCAAGAVDSLFHRLFQQVFAIAKDIRTTTAVGACPVSVASAAVSFIKQQLPTDFFTANVALIGAGDTSRLLMRYLKPSLTTPILWVNRSIEKAETLAQEFGGHVYNLDKITLALQKADIVFSATGSAAPIITKKMIQEVMQGRKEKPLMLVDIAVPRDIEAGIDVPHVSLYCIDDLREVIEKNRKGREHAGDKAKEIIRKKSAEFIAEVSSFDKVSNTIRAYRGQIEALCRQELLKAKQQLHQGSNPTEVLEAFAHAFTRKLLHTPSVQLRQAGVEGQFDLLRYAKQLFAIPDHEIERL